MKQSYTTHFIVMDINKVKSITIELTANSKGQAISLALQALAKKCPRKYVIYCGCVPTAEMIECCVKAIEIIYNHIP